MKRAMDRASGSGVFARDPDAQLDMIELELSDTLQQWGAGHGATAWRLEGSLREFENFVPVNFWFEYPIHRMDFEQELKAMPSQGSFEAGRMKNKRSKTAEEAGEEFRNAFQLLNLDGTGVTVDEIGAYLGLAERTVRGRVKKLKDEFWLDGGTVKNIDSKPCQEAPWQTPCKNAKKTETKKTVKSKSDKASR
jgi:hypothetical protein